jgi:hypothetical protein
MKPIQVLAERDKQEITTSNSFQPRAKHNGNPSFADTNKKQREGVMHLPQFSKSAIAMNSFLRLLLTLPVRREASVVTVSMGSQSHAVTGCCMTISTTKRAVDGVLTDLIFRLVSSRG